MAAAGHAYGMARAAPGIRTNTNRMREMQTIVTDVRYSWSSQCDGPATNACINDYCLD